MHASAGDTFSMYRVSIMEVSRPLVQSLQDSQGRSMVVRVDSKRRYDATAMARSYGKELDNYWRTKGNRGW